MLIGGEVSSSPNNLSIVSDNNCRLDVNSVANMVWYYLHNSACIVQRAPVPSLVKTIRGLEGSQYPCDLPWLRPSCAKLIAVQQSYGLLSSPTAISYASRVHSGKRKATVWCASVRTSVCLIFFLTLLRLLRRYHAQERHCSVVSAGYRPCGVVVFTSCHRRRWALILDESFVQGYPVPRRDLRTFCFFCTRTDKLVVTAE